MLQIALPHLRVAASSALVIILSSGADTRFINSGWMPYCVSKAALSRYLQCLAHEEDGSQIKIRGACPGVTRTPIAKDMLAGKYKNIMRDDEIEIFLQWSKDESFVQPQGWSGDVVGMMAADSLEGAKHGELEYYDIQVSGVEYKFL